MHPTFLIVVGLLTFFGLAIVVLVVKDKTSKAIWRLRNPPEKLAAEHAAFLKRLASPDWEFYGGHLQRPVPAALREAFASHNLVSRAHHFSEMRVTLSPIDKEAEGENWVLPGVVPFADSEGDPIFIEPGACASNAVLIAYHDGGGTEELTPSVEAFISELKHA